jgi:hypothetical protein
MTWPSQNSPQQPQGLPPSPQPGNPQPPYPQQSYGRQRPAIVRNIPAAARLWSYLAAIGAVLLLVGGGFLLRFESGRLPSVNRVAPSTPDIRLTNDEQLHFEEQAVYVAPASAAAAVTCEELDGFVPVTPEPVHRVTPDRPGLATRQVDGITYGFVGRASSFAAEIRCTGPGARGMLLTDSDRDHFGTYVGIAALVAAPFLALAGWVVNRVFRPRRRPG